MATTGKRSDLLRTRREHEHAKVGFVELFFDLVFVFAITQLSHALLEHFTLLGAIQTTLLLMAVWWVWVYTTWVTNWLDPETPGVRLMLFVLMLAGLVLSTSLPEAFGTRGLAFAAAYVFMQVGRSLFMVWALGAHSPRNRRNFQRITVWLALSGVCWIAGGLADGTTRFGLWGSRCSWSTCRQPWASGSQVLAARPPPSGMSKAATWPSAAGCSSSSRSASPS
jgi:low temperature requirement protein LtrA